MKKILTSIMIALLLFGGVAFAAVETATATLKTTIGETPNNSGIRIIEGTSPIGITEFDTNFNMAGSTLLINNTTINNAAQAVTGTFVVLVKRATAGPITVSITANPLLSLGADPLGYTLTSTTPLATGGVSNVLNISTTAKTGTYLTSAAVASIIRHPNMFTYNIPANAEVPFGVYEGDIVFTITLP